MLKSAIKRAEALIEREGSSKDADRLIIVVKASSKAAKRYKSKLKKALLREDYEESALELERGQMVVGFIIKASSIANDYPIFEADLVGVQTDTTGNVVTYWYADEPVVNIRPDDITLRGASCVDEDTDEFHQDIMACAQAIVYGTGRRHNPRRRR
jgi:hypothetical protein